MADQELQERVAWLDFSKSGPNSSSENEELYHVKLTALCTTKKGKGGKPIEDVEVQFYWDGAPFGGIEKTKQDGRVSVSVEALKCGKYTAIAQVVDTSMTERMEIPVGDQKFKKASQLIISSLVDNGKYDFSLQAVSDQGEPVQGVEIMVLDSRRPHKYKEFSLSATNVAGFTSHHASLAPGEKCKLLFLLPGVKEVHSESLHGKMEWKRKE